MARGICVVVLLGSIGCSQPVSHPVDSPQAESNPTFGVEAARHSATPPATGIPRPPKPDGWVEFVEPSNAFSIHTPAVPQADPLFSVPLPGGMQGPKIYRGSGNGLGVYMSFFDRQPEEVPTIRATMYERGGTAGLTPLGTVTARRDITWAGHEAAEFEVQSGTTTTVVRVLNVGSRFYVFHFAGQEGQPDAAAREAFFGSLSLGG